MAKYTNLNDLFTDMANAIRAKTGYTATIIADNFPTEIENLKTGFDYNNTDVTAIPDYAFYGCEDLKSVDCYNLTSVGASAFEGCSNLKSVILWGVVENVGENAFKGCGDSLTIYCSAESKPVTWHENWNPDNCEVVWGLAPYQTWDASATSNDNVIAKLYKDNGIYLLFIGGNGKMKDNADTFSSWKTYCNLTDYVIINNGITSIGSRSFYGFSGLTSITIPDSVTSIGDYVFYDCSGLTSITIPDGVTSIGNYAFYNCPSLTSITIPDSVTSIGARAFYGCSSLTSITIPDSVTSIGERAFRSCDSLTSINIPDSITSIGNGAFEYCTSLTSITIPDGVTRIDSSTFYNCSNLTSINIGNIAIYIADSVFSGCTSLEIITYAGTVAQWNAKTFNSSWNYNTGNYTIHCTDGDIAKDGTITYH